MNHHTLTASTGLVLTLLAAGLAGCSPSGGDTSRENAGQGPGVAASAAQAAAHPAGQPFELGDLVITLAPAQIKEQVGFDIAPERAAEGGVLVLVRYSVANHADKPVSAASLPEIKLVDAKGVQYAPDAGKTGAYAMASKLDTKLFSDLNPGITVKGAVVFEVANASFDPATWVALVDDQRAALR